MSQTIGYLIYGIPYTQAIEESIDSLSQEEKDSHGITVAWNRSLFGPDRLKKSKQRNANNLGFTCLYNAWGPEIIGYFGVEVQRINTEPGAYHGMKFLIEDCSDHLVIQNEVKKNWEKLPDRIKVAGEMLGFYLVWGNS